VLNGKSAGLVSDETVERVHAAARQLGYRVNSLAKGLKSGRTDLIGVYCAARLDELHSRLLHGIHDACYELGLNVLISYLDADERVKDEALQRMLDFNVAGLIRIVSRRVDDEEARLFDDLRAREETPCVLIDDPSHGDRFDSVVSDDFHGAVAVVEHLISLGHTRIGHVNLGNIGNRGRVARFEGFESAMGAAGLATDRYLIDPATDDEAVKRARAFLAEPDRPTALFCTNDGCAMTAREAARTLGLSVPGDLAISGYGNSRMAACSGLTSVQEGAEEMGRDAVRQLLARIDDSEAPYVSLIGATELIPRASTLGDSAWQD
jgi:LacI family transcriptional regulator